MHIHKTDESWPPPSWFQPPPLSETGDIQEPAQALDRQSQRSYVETTMGRRRWQWGTRGKRSVLYFKFLLTTLQQDLESFDTQMIPRLSQGQSTTSSRQGTPTSLHASTMLHEIGVELSALYNPPPCHLPHKTDGIPPHNPFLTCKHKMEGHGPFICWNKCRATPHSFPITTTTQACTHSYIPHAWPLPAVKWQGWSPFWTVHATHQHYLINLHHMSIDMCVAFTRLYGSKAGPTLLQNLQVWVRVTPGSNYVDPYKNLYPKWVWVFGGYRYGYFWKYPGVTQLATSNLCNLCPTRVAKCDKENVTLPGMGSEKIVWAGPDKRGCKKHALRH